MKTSCGRLLACLALVSLPAAQTSIEDHRLHASDEALTPGLAGFGHSIAADGDRVLVGAPGLANHPGAAYVYRFDGTRWNEEQKLVASDAAPVDAFGHALALHGDLALVAASGEDAGGLDSGSAYLFRRDGSGWHEERKLLASDADSGDGFTFAIALGRRWAGIGSFLDGVGSAYLYRTEPPGGRARRR